MPTSDRLGAAGARLLLVACSDRNAAAGQPQPADGSRRRASQDATIGCARDDAPLRRVCTVDRHRAADGLILTIRRPDGGFRRLLVTQDGRGVMAADGAEPVRVRVVDGGSIAVTAGRDTYRLPATIGVRR
jgi:hypothetical protein